ncbi:MAG TPA: AAA family ATPase, partial [Nocardioides sp.]|nr:AAA family ATPase [Nocardioides sp.]
LVGTISPPAYDAPPLPPAQEMARFVAAGLHRTVAEGRVDSEHRTATVAFVQYSGLDEIIDQSGGDAAARVLEALIAGTQEALDARGICFQSADLAVDGGKFYLSAGAPLSTGQDEEHMLLALAEIVSLDVGLTLRAGVNSGSVFTGEIRSGSRRTFVTMGDPVNLAARVMSKAAPGTVYATTPVLDRSRTLFDLTPVEPFYVKGKARSVTAFAVGAARGVRAEVASADAPLVGRESELDAFRAACASAAEHSGSYLQLLADPGAGKSRLLKEFQAAGDSIDFHRVACRLYQSSTPYFPFFGLLSGLLSLSDTDGADDLRRLVTERSPHLLPWLSLIGTACGLLIEPSPEVLALETEFRRIQLETAVVSLLEDVLTEPVALCIEDAQWMDDASCQLVNALVSDLARRPWVVLVAQRPDPGGPTAQIRAPDILMALHPLNPAELEALVGELTRSTPLPQHRIATLVERSGGNPLFLLELLNAVQAGDDDESLPTSVEGLLMARTDRLANADRTLLRHLSVLGTGFDRSYVADVAPRGASLSDEELARLAEFVRTDDRGWVWFRHDLVRVVAYEGLPFRTRRELHERVGESILRRVGDNVDDVVPLLSLHFYRANRHREAWRYSTAAGDQAKAVYANADAAKLYRRALQASAKIDVDGRLRAQALESLGDVEELTGNLVGARAAYVAARQLSGDEPIVVARMLLKSAFIDERLGRYVTAVRSVRRGLRVLAPLDRTGDELRAELWGWLAAIRVRQGQFAEGARAGAEAVRRATGLGDSSTLARALVTLDFARSRLEDGADHAGTERALDIYTELGDIPGEATAANILGAYAYFAGQWDDAVAFYRRSRHARERTGDPAGVATANANLAEILLEQGSLDEADALLASASSVWAASDDQWSVAFADRLRGLCRCRAGAFEAAEMLLGAARAKFATLGAQADVTETDVAIAELLLLSGNFEEAVDLLDTVIAGDPARAGLDHLLPAIYRLRGTARAAMSGDDGLTDLARALELSRNHEAEHEIALTIRALGLASGWHGEPVDPALASEGRIIAARLGLGPRLEPTPGVLSGRRSSGPR